MALIVTLKSAHGKYLGVQADGYVTANAEVAAAWEQFEVEPVGGEGEDKWALRCWLGTYLTATLDGSIRAEATAVYAWEEWHRLDGETDGTIAFISSHGLAITAEPDGTVMCRTEEVHAWECFVSEPTDWWKPAVPEITNRNLLAGELRRDKRVISDDSGPRALVFCHFMEAFSAWVHGRQSQVESQCRLIAEHYAGIRNLDVLGYWDCNRPGDRNVWSAWKGKEITSVPFIAFSGRKIEPTPNYWERKREFVTMLQDYRLKILDDRGDMNAWTNADKYGHMAANGQFYNGLGFGKEILGGLWAINEPWQNGGDDNDLLAKMIAAFKEGAGWLPAVCGLGAPGGFSDPDDLAACTPPMTAWEPEMPCSFFHWSKDPATVITVHGNRGDHTHIIEHYFGYGYDEAVRKYGKVAFNTEPVGGGEGVSVGRVDDPELLCGITAAAMIGGQPWVFMSGNGVFWNGPIETMPGFEEVPRLTQWIPQDIASWPTVIHSGIRFRGQRIMAVVDPTRFDQAIAQDGRFVAVCHTVEAPGNALPCERACAEFTAINMVTGEVEREGPLNVGNTYRHPGIARLIVGRLA